MDSRYTNTESETRDADAPNSRFQDEVDMKEEGSHTGEQWKKASQPSRRKSGMVVIRNINYITKAQNPSGSAHIQILPLTVMKINMLRNLCKTQKKEEVAKNL